MQLEQNNPIRAITFDVGGTLIEPFPGVGEVYAAVTRELGFGEFDPTLLARNFIHAWRNRSQFDYSRAEWKDLVSLSFADQCHVTDTLFEAIYDRFAQPQSWQIFDDVFPALESLQQSGFKLAIISNWDERLRPLLHSLQLTPWFHSIIISTEIGAHKPHPRIFHAAAQSLQTDPAQILHLGDSTREDLQGAQAAGFKSALIDRPSQTLLTLIKSMLE